MASKITRRDLRDDEVTRFLRFTVTESAAGTFSETSYDTQLSIDRGLIWLIHAVEFSTALANLETPAAGAVETAAAQITRESQTALLDLNDPDLIARDYAVIRRSAAIGTDAGPLWVYDHGPRRIDFIPPLPYAASTIYIGIQTSNAAAQTVTGRIHYTLRRVTDKFFYRVAQALIS